MKKIDTAGRRDPQALLEFLSQCREIARKSGRAHLVNITLYVRHIDPLAVLESIYEPTEMHFYLENASQGFAVAGADAVLSAEFTGEDRFAQVRQFAENIVADTLAIGDVDAPLAGPQFFSAFAFENRVDEGYPYAPATVFVPRWQVARKNGRYSASANLLIRADSNVEEMAMRVLAAHGRFSEFDYATDAVRAMKHQPKVVKVSEPGQGEHYTEAVNKALEMLDAGAFNKIVLARRVQILLSGAVDPLEWLNELRAKYAGCYAFSFSNSTESSFIGATPERLIKIEKDGFVTEALAGSAPRGETAREDAFYAGSLLQSEKDLREHQYVIQSILKRLEEAGLTGSATETPYLLQLSNVQHLKTEITGKLGGDTHLLDLADKLHPTPAVGGNPREDALPHIRALEEMERGLYAGTLGFFNHRGEGEMVVSIRSALVEKDRATLYAGAGIVKGSVPEKEKSETDLKLKAMLHTLTGKTGA